MKRITVFTLVVGADLVALAAVIAWYLAAYQHSSGSLGGVMGQMMGAGSTSGLTSAMPEGVWLAIVALVALAVAGFVGLGYFLTYPEIRSGPALQSVAPGVEPKAGPGMSWAILMRTSKPEEKKVLEMLAAHQGSYLQKFVVKEAGLSRLKTHRIVSRLAERRVVSVEKSGNTNQVSLAPWVKDDAVKSAAGP
ncbi:MAG: hypothetical protein KGI38_08865 [Thaumarchaeota archaeon]|nr:hypothetical protein [Nitrososphaerota archaeon]